MESGIDVIRCRSAILPWNIPKLDSYQEFYGVAKLKTLILDRNPPRMKTYLLLFFTLFSFSLAAQFQQEILLPEGLGIDRSEVATLGDKVFFKASSGWNGWRIWMSDGTPEGTRSFYSCDRETRLRLLGDQLYVIHGRALRKVFNTGNVETYGLLMDASITHVRTLGSDIILTTQYDTPTLTNSIYRFDPQTEELSLLFERAGEINSMVSYGDGVLFEHNGDLFYSDGTAAGTQQIWSNSPGVALNSSLNIGGEFGGLYLFRIVDEAGNVILWGTDGTQAGTAPIGTTIAGARSSTSDFYFSHDEWSYFTAWNERYEINMYRTNGVTTEQVFSLYDELGIVHLYNSFRFQDEVYFNATSLEHGYETWKTDGTAAGTYVLKDIFPGGAHSFHSVNRPIRRRGNEEFYFVANNGENGMELWRSNGTTAGTELALDYTPGVDWTSLEPMGFDEEDRLYVFVNNDYPNDERSRLIILDPDALTSPVTETPKNYDWFRFTQYPTTGSSSATYNYDLEVDGAGNVYLTGDFDGRHVLLGSSGHVTRFDRDGYGARNFLASYGTDGQFRWAKRIGNRFNFSTNITALATDGENNVICSATLANNNAFDDLQLEDSQQYFYVAKFDTDGERQWLRRGFIGNRGPIEVSYMTTDEAGNIYVGGTYTGNWASLGTAEVSSSVSPALFLAKYDPDGNDVWIQHIPIPIVTTTYVASITAIQVFNDRIYVTTSDGGPVGWRASCDFRTFVSQIMVLDMDGTRIRKKRFASSEFTFISNAKFSPEGQLHVIGRYAGDFTADQFRFYTPCEDPKGYLLKLDADLNVIEAREESAHTLYDVEFGENGTYYLSGRQVLDSVPEINYNYYRNQRNKTFVRKYDKYDRLLAERNFSKFHRDSHDSNPMIAIDNEEKIILAERFRGTFDTLPTTLSWSDDVALLKFELDATPDYPTDEQIADSDLRLFPNPAGDVLYLDSEDEDFNAAHFEIFDAAGRLLLVPNSRYSLGVIRLNVSPLPAGNYFLRVTDAAGNRFSRAFVKGD